MSAQVLAFRPTGLIAIDAVSSDPAVVWAYLQGVDAGERHGYARGRLEGLGDLWRAVRGYWTVPIRRRRAPR